MAKSVNILVQIDWGTRVGFDIVDGIREFALTQPRWSLRYVVDPIDKYLADGPFAWRADGAIISSAVSLIRHQFPHFACPTVSIVHETAGDVSVLPDDRAIGRLAAEHLAERGYQRFGYVCDGPPQGAYKLRLEGYQAALTKRGFTCSVAPSLGVLWQTDEPVVQWARSLPRPAGIFCGNDRVAGEMVGLCRTYGIRVPEDVAVVGADNDLSWCATSATPLSSVAIGWGQIGQTAANWLRRLLAGGKPPSSGCVLVPPLGVVARRSTEMLAIDDPLIVQAIGFLRERACEGISVKHVLEAVPVSRRHLERAFRAILGRSPHDEIHRIQVERAKELLAKTDLPQLQIARQVGLSMSQFGEMFRLATEKTPGKYREACRIRTW